MVLSSPHVKPRLLSRLNPQHGERRAGILDLLGFFFGTKLKKALGMQFMPRCDQYVHNAHRQNRISACQVTEQGEEKGTVGFENYSILESFSLLSGECIIPWSNARTLNEAFLICWSDMLLAIWALEETDTED